jgi:hypothetical protein
LKKLTKFELIGFFGVENKSKFELLITNSKFTLISDLLLSHLLLVLFDLFGVHLLEGISGGVVGLVDNGVVLLVAFDDALGGSAVHYGRAARQAGRWVNMLAVGSLLFLVG